MVCVLSLSFSTCVCNPHQRFLACEMLEKQEKKLWNFFFLVVRSKNLVYAVSRNGDLVKRKNEIIFLDKNWSEVKQGRKKTLNRNPKWLNFWLEKENLARSYLLNPKKISPNFLIHHLIDVDQFWVRIWTRKTCEKSKLKLLKFVINCRYFNCFLSAVPIFIKTRKWIILKT